MAKQIIIIEGDDASFSIVSHKTQDHIFADDIIRAYNNAYQEARREAAKRFPQKISFVTLSVSGDEEGYSAAIKEGMSGYEYQKTLNTETWKTPIGHLTATWLGEMPGTGYYQKFEFEVFPKAIKSSNSQKK